MSTITVITELCAEDRARLDKILEALTSKNCQDCATSVAKYVTAEVSQAAAEHPVADPFPEPEPAPEPEAPAEPAPVADPAPATEAPTVSQSDVQKLVVELSAAGMKEQVREIVTEYAARVSLIPEDKLAEAWARLTALNEK